MGWIQDRRIGFYAKRALWILVAWVIIANLIFLYDVISLYNASALDSNFDFRSEFFANLVVAISAGILGGLLTVNLMEYWLRKYAFWQALVLITVVYIVSSAIVSMMGAIYMKSQDYNLPFLHPDVLEESTFIFETWEFQKNFIIWLLSLIHI